MTDSGLQGIEYTSKPQNDNLIDVPEAIIAIELKVEKDKGIAGNYTLMIRASLLENDQLILSLLSPQPVKMDVPTMPSEMNKIRNFQGENPNMELIA